MIYLDSPMLASATNGSSGGLLRAPLSTLAATSRMGAWGGILSRYRARARPDGLRGFARLRLALGFLASCFLLPSFLLFLRPHRVLQKVFISEPYPIFSFDKLRTGEPRRFADIEQLPRGAVGFSRVTSLSGLPQYFFICQRFPCSILRLKHHSPLPAPPANATDQPRPAP